MSTYRTPRAYRYRGHTIEPLSGRVCGPEGWLYWRVIPDNGETCWDARSLADARDSIWAAELEAAEAEGHRVLAALRDANDRELRLYGRPLQPGEWPPGWIDNGNSQTTAQGVA